MKQPLSTNLECRAITLALVIEEYGSMPAWLAYLKGKHGMSDEKVMKFCTERGFMDEEVDGALISLR